MWRAAARSTHLHHLTLFADAHAGTAVPTAYDIAVSDPIVGMVSAVLRRNGIVVLDWTLIDH